MPIKSLFQPPAYTRIPKTAQDTIPIQRIYPDGVFFSGGQYSKSFAFRDINYSVASPDDQLDMFMNYSAILNSLDAEATTKITIHNRRLDHRTLTHAIDIPMAGDRLDIYRREYNGILYDMTAGSHATVQEKYITLSVARKDIEDARAFFDRAAIELEKGFARLSSKVTALSTNDRLQLFHDFYRDIPGEFTFDLKAAMGRGHDFRDAVCPEAVEFKSDHFTLGSRFGRVLFLADYASFIKDKMITDLTDFDRNLLLSIDIIPVATDEAVKLVQKQMLSIDTDRARFQSKQNRAGNFSAHIPYGLEQATAEAKEFLDDLTTRDQRMMFVYVTLVHTAESLATLDSDTKQIISIGRTNFCQFATMKYRQEDGLNTALPYGPMRVHPKETRTLTTESTAVLIPFRAQEIIDRGGICYGINAISRNPIICNRKELLNPHGWILGVSGSGKSLSAKEEITLLRLTTDDDIIIPDAEGEYTDLVAALGGETVELSAASVNHVNAMDFNKDYGDTQNPLVLKMDFLLTLFERIMGTRELGAVEKSIIDRSAVMLYETYMEDYEGQPPTLRDYHRLISSMPEPEARNIALSMELFSTGSLSIFAHQTNVDMSNRLMSFNLRDMGKQLKPVGMLILLDALLNRVTRNRSKGRFTHIFIDEAHIYFSHEHSAIFLEDAAKRFRKFGAPLTFITQNIEEVLRSPQARLMLANSEFLRLFNQSPTDRAQLADILRISDAQLSHITNAQAGHGLIKVGSSIVPFKNELPKHTELYRLMTTKPGER